MQVGIIGLGKMGSRIAAKLISDNHDVVVWNRSSVPVLELKNQISNLKIKTQNLKVAKTIQEFVQDLGKPRVIWVMVPAGSATQNILDEISKYIQKDDIVIDGGNAFYKDTEKRYQQFEKKSVRYLGVGVSGGVHGEKNGYSLMAGGDKTAYCYIVPLLDCLSKPNGGYDYFGAGGAGHFVKMVHNGIEYGMMQSIGEGFGVLERSPYKFDLLKVAKIWQKGTIISGFLMDRTKEVFEKGLNDILGVINATGEAEWMVKTAKEEGVGVEIIEKSLEFRKRSQTDKKIQNSFAAKVVAGLRNAFGGHGLHFSDKSAGHEIKKK